MCAVFISFPLCSIGLSISKLSETTLRADFRMCDDRQGDPYSSTILGYPVPNHHFDGKHLVQMSPDEPRRAATDHLSFTLCGAHSNLTTAGRPVIGSKVNTVPSSPSNRWSLITSSHRDGSIPKARSFQSTSNQRKLLRCVADAL